VGYCLDFTRRSGVLLMPIPMRAFCINRDDRFKRWEDVQKEFERYNLLDIERFSAFVSDTGWEGCRDSHLTIMGMCQEEQYFFIFEDDVTFITDPTDIVCDALSQLPLDWDCLYLGASPKEPQVRYSANLFKLNYAHVTHAIVWHNRKGGAVEYMLNHKEEIVAPIDVYFANVLQHQFNFFVVYPMVATQRMYGSDTGGRGDTTSILRYYNKFCK
jgi:GR25 family glycosyltransferase involved in LPS biosynthesis